ncbi:MAG: hypothetical protein RIE06_10535 [Roseibium album]|uniref:BBC1/AIM3 cysteine proteinase-fold domain-containing protein n=1 Tax=Roseibium album TaxID=311410 RepID=A0A0M7AD13_9HYPH|nr:hypothetical protein [Roseibium album]MBG6145614.1 hypothetical protein [Labrenzia sp. EL_142]MBG6157691.1 hypothetical protein [Labrenzia sp. EL_162]MBG6163121.1 hypothetical protein [Labrenzia sp. EL_195]MBG6174546.1 hypothetical protein [Labrenzia sp. EL_132]MBG6195916.1 hypothetical protein [Labrenzia sp. EL_159]MBG6201341.1 hypothetical protein [Labrenzia sp. EL_13]MBG6208999.1 hypothetical protein [Labrenzia sp. EL_126]MBG6229172.1 hypothetical protein [Labrenzia sp. EL_208]MCR905
MRDVTEQEAQRLIAFATERLGRQEGNGQCWTLVNNAFENLDFHKPSAIYNWGREVEQLANARPGDVFQFSRFEVTVRVENDGGYEERTESRGAPRHTAILESIDENGIATFLECNVYENFNVQRNRFYVRTADLESGEGERTTVRVSGRFTIYRPQKSE